MKIAFLRLNIENFKSYTDSHSFSLDRQVGVWFIRGRNRRSRLGSNGSGKSSLWDALVWCLYGTTPSGLRNPDVRPWRHATGPTIVTTVVNVDGVTHIIARSINPNLLTIDKDPVGPEAVVKLIGMTYEVMTNTIILGQGQPLFFDLPPARKLEMLSEAKQLDRWDIRSKQSTERAKTLESELATVDGEITGLTAGAKKIKEGMIAVEKEDATWREANEKNRAKLEKFLKTANEQLDELGKATADADLKYDSSMTEVKACEQQISQLGLDVAAAQSNLTRVRERRREIKIQIAKFGNNICPTCGQPLKLHDANRKHRHLEKSLKKTRTRAIRIALETAQSNLEHAKKYLDVFHSKADSAMRTLKQKQEEHARLSEEIKSAKKDTIENPHTALLRLAKQRLRDIHADLEGAIADKRIIERELVRAQFWAKGFKEIKLHVIEEFLQELEITTAGMLDEVGLVGWQVKYLIERETKKGTVKRGLTIMIGSPESKGLVKWESWSGGEAQRLRLVGALSLASVLLNHAGVEPSIEVLDEPTQHLSDEGIHDLCDFLADRAKLTERRIFYADHQSVDSARFAGTITVRHDKLGSYLKSGS